jgi:cysteine-rich repeat protein
VSIRSALVWSVLFAFTVVLGFPSTAFAVCGDGVVEVPDEDCDDSNTVNGDGCNSRCRVEPQFICPGPVSPLNQHPVGWWRLGDAALTHVTDISSTRNHGTYRHYDGPACATATDCQSDETCSDTDADTVPDTCIGGTIPTFGEPGVSGGDGDTAVRFDGWDDYAEVPHDAAYFVDRGSISFWFNADSLPSSPIMGLVSKDAQGFGSGGHLGIWVTSAGALRFRLQDATADNYASTADGFVNSGVWYHVVATFGVDGMQLYVNGMVVASNAAHTGGLGTTSGGTGNTEPLVFGANAGRSASGSALPLDSFFAGMIDEVMFFDRQLSSTEVEQINTAYTGPFTGGACAGGTPTTCGDGLLQAGEGCDDGGNADGDGCSSVCTIERCGDGMVLATEACDDGNRQGGDGCDMDCVVETGYSCSGEPSVCSYGATCGDGMVGGAEECDDGNTVSGDGCSAECVIEFCGDGLVNNDTETCDDYNTTAGDGCDANCQVETGWSCSESSDEVGPLPSICVTTCGDGVMTGPEECDDGNTTPDDGCNEFCRNEVCGDGKTHTGEECDDGNTADGDGCSATCTIESGYLCDTGGCVPETTCDPTVTSKIATTSGSHNLGCPIGCSTTTSYIGAYDLPAFDIAAGEMFAMDSSSHGKTGITVTVDIATPEACVNGFCGGAATCSTDADCSGGETCYDSVCTPTCSTDADCPSSSTCTVDSDGDLSDDACSPQCTSARSCGPDSNGWTNLVTSGTSPYPTNGTSSDYDVELTSTGSFSHPGGWVLVRYRGEAGSILTYYDYGSTSRRTFSDADGVWPWDDTYLTSYAPAFEVRTGADPCVQFGSRYQNGGTCNSTTSMCDPPSEPADCTRDDNDCCHGYSSSSRDCDASDRFDWYRYDCCSGGFCECLDLREYDYYCYTSSSPAYAGYGYCSYDLTTLSSETENCQSCDDGDACTADSCSTTGCVNSQISPSTCYQGPDAARSTGMCSDGVEYCSSPDVCVGDVWPQPEACDSSDNDCDAAVDESPEADAACDDGDAATADVCNTGTCENPEICTDSDTHCDDGSGVCQDCNALDGWYADPSGSPYDCCSAGESCTCTPEEYRDYVCVGGGMGCEYTATDTRVAISGCASCDDSNLCTDDSCDPASGLCENVDNTYSEACYTGPAGTEGVGICAAGTHTCSGGSFGTCDDTTPGVEACDGIDNDCNGLVDDGDADADCTVAGQLCFWGICDDSCMADGDCAAGEICVFENGQTTGRCALDTGTCDDVDPNCPNGASCYDGGCTNTNCGNDLDCDVYSKCYKSGRCLHDDSERCNGVQCPQGETCVKGTCAKSCTQNVDCTDPGHKCFDGYCFPETDPCEGVDCEIGFTCWQGTCYQDCIDDGDCTRDPTHVCYDATRCAPPDDPCQGIICADGDICYQGSCYPDCTTANCTDADDACYDATRCATDNCEGVQCPTGETCHGGQCYVTCSDDLTCQNLDPSHLCYGGICTDDPCTGVQCAPGEVCSQGQCYVTCGTDADCQALDPSHLCYDGLCTDDPCAGVLCLSDQICYGGTCYPYCDMMASCVDPGDICWDTTRCEVDACTGVACPSEQFCYEGSCYYSCVDDGDCTAYDPSHACYDGRCTDDPCAGINCPIDEVCYGGSCYVTCTDDADCSNPDHACYDNRCAMSPCDGVQCASDEVCYEGTCYQSCNGTIDCTDPNHVCYDNRCQDPCDSTTCLAGEICYLGTCYEYCDGVDPCSNPDHVCYQNRCVDDDDPWCDGVTCPMGESCYRGTCYESCGPDVDCSDPNAICYQDVCVPQDCSGTICDSGEICYNGVCYQSCNGDVDCSDPSHACYDERCATSACEAQATTFLDDYDDNHLFHAAGNRLFGFQYSTPWLWPRPYEDPGVDFSTWADVGSNAGDSSGNDALFSKGAARVVLFYDDTDGDAYKLYLIQGSKDGAQGPTESTYSIRVKSADPELELMDDVDREAFRESPESDNWTHVQAHVTTGASETGGIAIGKFSADSDDWRIEINANFGGDIDRWELMNGETGEPMATLSTTEPFSLRSVNFADTAEIQPEYGTICSDDKLGICERGTVTECVNWELNCEQTIFPWGFEVCDGQDNTCNGLVDTADSTLRFGRVETKQGFADWRPWPTIDTYEDVNDWLRYSPRDPSDDRVGSTAAVRPDMSPLQDPDKTYMVMHRDLGTGEFSMPMLIGAEASDDDFDRDEIEGDSRVRMSVRPRPGGALEDTWVCWYDDRQPASTSDDVLEEWDRSDRRMRLEWEVEEEDGQHESDAGVIRPLWLEGATGNSVVYGVRYRHEGDRDEERVWRRYSPYLSDLRLSRYARMWVRISATDPDESYCVSDSMTANGCPLGVYTCTPSGIECSEPDDSHCSAGCFDYDGDGFVQYDPAYCPSGDDCNDFDPETYPEAPEYCNGRDNDCDGRVDIQSANCANGAPSCGPVDCGGIATCRCPDGEREEVGDPEDKCVCAEALQK